MSRHVRTLWALVALSGGCAGGNPPPNAQTEPVVSIPSGSANTVEPPAPGAEREGPGANASPAVETCEDYLREYERCEPKLAPSIAAGERRRPAAERAWLDYLEREGTPRKELDESCRGAYRSIEALCR